MVDNTNSYQNESISTKLLPRIYRSNANKKFLQATIDQLIQPGSIQKINGYIGRQNSKASTSNDNFIEAATSTRQNYQLEPSLIIKDNLDNITFFKDYQDYINQLSVLGGNVSNHPRLNDQEFYSWNPHICWDKFVNFQQYYWIPEGPKAITINKLSIDAISTYQVVLKSQGTSNAYIFSPDGYLGNKINPTITLYRGYTYHFEVNCPGNPFGIKDTNGNNYNNIIPLEKGIISIKIPIDAPNKLYYQSDIDEQLKGTFNIKSVDIDRTINISTKEKNNIYEYEIFSENYIEKSINPKIVLYRSQSYYFNLNNLRDNDNKPIEFNFRKGNGEIYTSSDIEIISGNLSNGKFKFNVTNSTPSKLYYRDGNDKLYTIEIISVTNESIFNVDNELSGKKTYSIILENDFNLTISNGIKLYFGNTVNPSSYRNKEFYIEGVGTSIKLIPVEKLSLPNKNLEIISNDINSSNIVYVVINKASQTYNQWSRYNRWFHKDILEISANYHKENLQFSQIARATRPIIEFDGELKLFNYGTKFVDDVDLFDVYTKDAFHINGLKDYYIDGISLKNLINSSSSKEIRVLFNETGIIYKIKYNSNTASLVLSTSELPERDQVIQVKSGNKYTDNVFWYTLNSNNQLYWQSAQQKIFSDTNQENKNQFPIFDVVDDEGVSFSNVAKYNSSTFNGTKLFSYKINENGVLDSVLKLKLSYKNIENSGDILFNFDFDTDTFYYKDEVDIQKNVNSGFLQKNKINGNIELVNTWQTSNFKQVQPAIRIYKNFNLSIDDEDKFAKEYDSEIRYYSGDIVRYQTGDLYRVKTDGSVLDTGIIGINPLNVTDLNIISYTVSELGSTSVFNTYVVTGITNNTDNIFMGDTIKIDNASGDLIHINGSWTINRVIDSNEFEFIVNTTESIPLTQYTSNLGTSKVTGLIPLWEFYKKSSLKLNNFELDIFNDKDDLEDLIIQVYINSVRLPNYLWSIIDSYPYKKIVLNKSIKLDDILTIKAFAKQPINDNGFYQIPINLQQNPLNDEIKNCTFGEILDHVKSITDNFTIHNPDLSTSTANNLRDLGNISFYGTKFVQHSGPLSLSLYHITSETNNIVKAITQSSDDYNKFKRSFINTAETLGIDTDIISHVNLILKEINKNKPETFPYYFSDMVPYGSYQKNDFTVVDYRIKLYPLTFDSSIPFNLNSLSNKAVYVYLNNQQLYYGREYTFTDQNFIEIKANIQNNDIISIYEYDTTDGSFIPETPTKLGLWPKYEPKIYWDTTLVTPRMMIQGHDGSLTLAYGNYPNGIITKLEYRDALLLELEQRIYNNIKVSYNDKFFNIYEIIPMYGVENQYNLDEFNQILSSNFYRWVNLVGRDFTKQLSFNKNNSFTFNYDGYLTLDNKPVPRYWRGIYQWMLGTDRPHICPWEMLGFSEEPEWWKSKYGAAPYSSNNILMWKDISLGIINDPNKPITQIKRFIRPFLLDHLPVNQAGDLISPLEAGLVVGTEGFNNSKKFIFGDVSPVEAAWRRSSHYPFSVINTALMMFPAKLFSLLLDVSRTIKNASNQLIYTRSNIRIRPKDVIFSNIIPSEIRIQTAGIINYLVNYIIVDKLKSFDQYKSDLSNIQCTLSYRIGGFTSKEKFNLLLDSKSLSATGNVFVPKEDYYIFLNNSSPIKKITYSGVIITKLPEGFEVKGYIRSQPYFKYYQWIQSGPKINVGGISENYLIWSPNEYYNVGKIVEYNNKFYRVKKNHSSLDTFDNQYYQLLPSLPMIGGKEAIFRSKWDRSTTITVPYGTRFSNIQEVVDFLLGYGEWLKDQGFMFDQFNNNMAESLDWETSAKEFLFWTTQNWSTGQDKWDEWDSTIQIVYKTIVQYNGEYYQAIRNVPAGIIPNEADQYSMADIQYYEKLDGLSTIGSSVISLSPLAFKLTFNASLAVVNDIRNQFYDYEIFSVNGLPINPNSLEFYREENVFSYLSKNNEGIYGAVFYLIQKEQIVVINNTTIFNDLIYNPSTGYKQDRFKVSGYVSIDWDGGFNAPGFIFDQAKIKDWVPWTDYILGDMVKYKEFYYSAKSFIPGEFKFDPEKWLKLENIPTSRLLPNWSYKAAQFVDFHNLDNDNFDSDQQRMAQHLIGYQKRQYLNNIIKDDVSEFKFYQGMIIEKGTQNVFNKLFDALSANNQESMEFYEEWALRVGRYGASSSYESIEFILDESKFKTNPQGFELLNNIQNNSIDFIIRQRPADIYLRPKNYNSSPFPLSAQYKSYFRNSGLVQETDVRFICKNLNELINQDINKFIDNDYIWCTFIDTSWGLYKFVLNNNILSITQNNSDKTWILELRFATNLNKDDYIGVVNISNGNGFYQIIDVIDPYKIKIKYPTNINTIPTIDSTKMNLVELSDQHVDYFDQLADNSVARKIFSKKLIKDNLLWLDGDLSTPASTWIYSPVYEKTALLSYSSESNLRFGKSLACNYEGTLAVVATDKRKAFVFNRASSKYKWVKKSQINIDKIDESLADNQYLKVLAMSKDGKWLAIGTPNVRNIKVSQNNSIYVVSSTGNNFESQGVVSLYEISNDLNEYNLKFIFASPDCTTQLTNQEQFGSSLVFGNNELFIGANNYNNGVGRVYSLKYNESSNKWSYGHTFISQNNYNFGYKLAINADNSILAISAPGNNISGIVNFYNASNKEKILEITRPDSEITELFGHDISFSISQNYIAISSKINEKGIVYVYQYNVEQSTYNEFQRFTRLMLSDVPGFGDKIRFIENSNVSTSNNNTLIIYDNINYSNTNEEKFYDLTNTGLVNIYDVYDNKWILSEVIGTVKENAFGIEFGVGFTTSKNTIIIGSPNSGNNAIGSTVEYKNNSNKLSWVMRNKEELKVDVRKIKKAFLYNRITNKLITYLDVIDCFQNKIPGIADQEIKFKTYYDPAIYSNLTDLENGTSYSYKIGDNIVNIDNGTSWTKSQVGTLWWDLRKTKFIDVYNKDIIYRNNFQNTLTLGAEVDIYEWVESKYKPDDWDNLSNSEEGYSLGISGTSLYGNSVYSVQKRYDKISKSYKFLYYFWVKNKKTTPNISERKLSAYNISNLISNVRGQGYKYLTVTGTNSFSLVNIENLLVSDEIVLSIEYWLTDNINQNIHSEWYLFNNNVVSQIPKHIEQKWFDSLVGKDANGLLVPDPSLSKKIRYGIENRPRQSMFINRFEALKEFVDYANIVLKKHQITNQKDITKLEKYSNAPSVYSGQYDIIVDTYEELAEINVQGITTALLIPNIVNGRIISINIVNSGKRYGGGRVYNEIAGTRYGPTISIVGTGKDAILKSIINDNGEIVEVVIINSGEGYNNDTRLTVRNYSVLVNEDSKSFNKWSIYSYNLITKLWNKVTSQSYRVTDYWNYIDWYATGYSQFTVANYAVDTFADLISIDAKINDLVKIRQGGGGKWVLLRKYSNVKSMNWNEIYETIGMQNGTIQLKTKLYDLFLIPGYDGTFYDSDLYDNLAFEEVRIILEVLRDYIFIDDLRIEYLNLFFTSLRYILSEQSYVDWAFKTSFIKAKHNVGNLTQKITYRNDNLENFEDYIAEVKPYRTKIREYVSSYNQLDNLNLSVTDFDLPPIIENQQLRTIFTSIVNEVNPVRKVVIADSDLVQSYPWKHWYDNCKPSILRIDVISEGIYYQSAYTKVQIVGVEAEEIATAKAVVDDESGKIVEVIVTNPGKGYYVSPQINIVDIREDVNILRGQDAVAIAIIGSPVRSSLIKMKFDRISSDVSFEEITEIEEFTFSNNVRINADAMNFYLSSFQSNEDYMKNNGYLAAFKLRYKPTNKIKESLVHINNIELFDDFYVLEWRKVDINNYTYYIGILLIKDTIFDSMTLTSTNKVKIEYYRDQSLLSATDRIEYYYNSSEGKLGKDISQLMTSINYGGVSISGLNFLINKGWDSLPFYTDRWDFIDNSFTDVTFIATNANKNEIKLPTVPIASTLLNVYYSKYYSNIINLRSISGYDNPEYDLDLYDKMEILLEYQFDKNIVSLLVFANYNGQIIQETQIGSNVLIFNNISDIKIGDNILDLNEDEEYFIYDTRVIEVDKAQNKVRLSHPLIKTLPVNSMIRIRRRLIEPDDLRVYLNEGKIIITSNTLSPYHYLELVGYYREIQIDNINFNKTWNVTEIDDNSLIITTDVTFFIGDAIKFTGTTFGNINSDLLYYVHSIDNNKIKISVSKTGPVFNLTNSSGNMSFNVVLEPTIIMPTWVADGNNDTIIVPLLMDIQENDKFIVRKGNSDGSIRPFELDYDIDIDGGNIAYSTAKGIDADDLIIDGDDFVNTITYPTLEEILPGHVVDTLAIKVYDKNRQIVDNSTSIKVDTYLADGENKIFSLSQTPNNPSGLFVKVDGEIKSFTTDYQVNVNKNQIKFTIAPSKNSLISIFNIGFNQQVLDVDYIIATGSTSYVSKYPYSSLPNLNLIVYVNGIVVPNVEFFKSINDTIAVRLIAEVNSLIAIVLVKDSVDSFAVTNTEQFVGRSTNEYVLQSAVGISTPVEPNMIVRINQDILQDNEYQCVNIDINQVKIIFNESYGPETVISVTSSYNHNILSIQRNLIETISEIETIVDPILYRKATSMASGLIKLDYTIINDNYIWVIQNKKLLTSNIDYKLNEDHQSIQLANNISLGTIFDIITFNSNIQYDFAYMQFKDMLNKTSFIRLNQLKQTKLTKELKFNDLTIEVEDARNFDIPNRYENKPGVIDINGERIEYFSINGNTLSSLRRGTLGTGIKSIYQIGTMVQEIGQSETIPYNDSLTIDEILYNNLNSVQLSTINNIISEDISYKGELIGNNNNLKAKLAKNSIDIFVTGYKVFSWKPEIRYIKNDLVVLAGYTYRCIKDHISSKSFRTDYSSKWELFVSNTRLMKNRYKMFDLRSGIASPDGDVLFEPDFTVNGLTNEIILNDKLSSLSLGSKIIVTKKTGLSWDGEVCIQDFVDNNSTENMKKISKIIKFIKSAPGSTFLING